MFRVRYNNRLPHTQETKPRSTHLASLRNRQSTARFKQAGKTMSTTKSHPQDHAMNIIFTLFIALLHIISTSGLYFSSYLSELVAVTLGQLSFISMLVTGIILSNNLGPRSGKPSAMCRPLCGSLAAVLWLEWAIVESIFGEENYLWGPTIAWGMIWYWCGFALEWKTGYCHSFVEVVARLTEADCA
ncbi:hypothetical protein M434DRAFT_31525 [Hypoxylon sp. CO27-5]|nr:hypothetical protein M434DRAFT_31525 [Hypoxylon sp. CO27-5]